MRSKVKYVSTGVLVTASALWAQDDPIKTLVGRLDLERYKATIRGLAKFGDRREGTDRNRAAIQHDMMLFDHGMPRKGGTVNEHHRPEADVNIEFQSRSKSAAQAAELVWAFRDANEKYATDYPLRLAIT